jgi:hypothetical protein
VIRRPVAEDGDGVGGVDGVDGVDGVVDDMDMASLPQVVGSARTVVGRPP